MALVGTDLVVVVVVSDNGCWVAAMASDGCTVDGSVQRPCCMSSASRFGYSTTGDSLREVMYAESFEIDIQKLLEGRRERER